MEEKIIVDIIKEIIIKDVNDGIEFQYEDISEIMPDSNYNCYSIKLKARFGKINARMKIDISTGDIITPSEVDYQYKFIFENRNITIKAYPIETIIAEKYETILKRNTLNTRSRDLYNLYILYKLQKENINFENLGLAIKNTCKKRNTTEQIKNYKEIINDIQKSEYQRKLWEKYKSSNSYSKNINFDEIIEVLKTVGEKIT